MTALRREARELKEVVAEQTLELQLLKKNHISDPQLVPQCDLYGDEGGVSRIIVEHSFKEQGIAFKVLRISPRFKQGQTQSVGGALAN